MTAQQLAPPVHWQDSAACAPGRIDYPEWWYPLPGQWRWMRLAKQVCAGCPVRVDCLTWGIETRDRWAILGGFTAAERDPLIDLTRQGHKARAVAELTCVCGRIYTSLGALNLHRRGCRGPK